MRKCYITISLYLFMNIPTHLPIYKEKVGITKKLLFHNYLENVTDRAHKQQISIEENGKKNAKLRRRQLDFLKHLMRKKGLENVTLTEHIEDTGYRKGSGLST